MKRYAEMHGSLLEAARHYTDDVARQRYPDEAHSYV